MLTHGYLSRLLMLLAWVGDGKIRNMRDFRALSHCNQEESFTIEKFCSDFQIIRTAHGPSLELTESGRLLVSMMPDHAACFRKIIAMYIRAERPGWAYRISAGRAEAYAMMNKDLKFCFRAAGLMDGDISDEVLSWWDEMAQELRGMQDDRHLEVGRRGERLTLQYELDRVKQRPVWKSVESNFVGYDILSVAGVEDSTPRLIEVKSSSARIEDASMKISAHEWDTACMMPDRYCFYLWSLTDATRLAVLSYDDVEPHIAENRGAGCWESIDVAFSLFKSRFVDVSL